MAQLPGIDFHVHATYYRAQGRREDMTASGVIRRCEEVSLEAAGIVEHLNGDPKHPVECLRDLVREGRGVSSGMQVYFGAELDVLDERGSVTGSEKIKDELRLDYFLAAVHGVAGEASSIEEFVEKNHRRLMGVAENCAFVEVIAHPWSAGHALKARGIQGEWSLERVPEKRREEFIGALAGSGKAFEVNSKAERDFGDDAYREFIERLRDAGVKVAVGSDAHSMDRIGAYRVIVEFLEEMAFPAEQLWMPGRR